MPQAQAQQTSVVPQPATKSISKPPANASPLKETTPKPLEIEIHGTPETKALFRQTRALEKAQALENKQRAAAQAVGNTPPAFKNLTPPRPANTVTAPQTRVPSVKPREKVGIRANSAWQAQLLKNSLIAEEI